VGEREQRAEAQECLLMGRYYCGVKQGPTAAGRTVVSVGWQKLGYQQRGGKGGEEKRGKNRKAKRKENGGARWQSRNYLLINRSPVTGKNVIPRNDEKKLK